MGNTMTTKYFICGYSDNMGQTFDGRPSVYTEDDLRNAREKANTATDGTWDVLVLAEIEVPHEAKRDADIQLRQAA